MLEHPAAHLAEVLVHRIQERVERDDLLWSWFRERSDLGRERLVDAVALPLVKIGGERHRFASGGPGVKTLLMEREIPARLI